MQGALGWLIFLILGVGAPVLLGVLIAVLSLLPAVGAPVVWVPVAIYLYATGQVWQSITLAVFGALVIGSADNILRPILVGKDTKLPDYVVLISTLGGLAVFDANGFVIGPVIAALFVACGRSSLRQGRLSSRATNRSSRATNLSSRAARRTEAQRTKSTQPTSPP